MEENRALREIQFRQIEYIRKKTNQLLLLMGTLPIRPEELDDDTLIDIDPIGVVAESFVQILEHEKHLNEQLRSAHDEIQAILESVGIGIMVLDCDMNIQIHNQRMLEMFGFEEASLSGKTCCQELCRSDSYPPSCTFKRIMETRRPVHQTDWIQNGKHFEVSGVPVKNRFGDVIQVVLAYSDITKRIEAEQSLRDREQMYLEVFENAGDIVQCVAPDGSFLFVNRAWRENLGYSTDEIAGLKIWNIIAPENRGKCIELFNALLKGVQMPTMEIVFFSKDCKELMVKGQVTCSFTNGKPMATFGMFRIMHADKSLPSGK
jgi:two-component system phosphate regulon sensor histidine kinase PhoR